MLIFDIDDTISPTQPPADWSVPHETKRAGWNVKIPSYMLDFLRSRDDIALLSTWGDTAVRVSEAFGFNAQILVMDEGTYGIEGKFNLVKRLENVKVWADDHMKPNMRKAMEAKGVHVVKPKNGVISEKELADLIASL